MRYYFEIISNLQRSCEGRSQHLNTSRCMIRTRIAIFQGTSWMPGLSCSSKSSEQRPVGERARDKGIESTRLMTPCQIHWFLSHPWKTRWLPKLNPLRMYQHFCFLVPSHLVINLLSTSLSVFRHHIISYSADWGLSEVPVLKPTLGDKGSGLVTHNLQGRGRGRNSISWPAL